MIVYFFGQPGSGKTTLAKEFVSWRGESYFPFNERCIIDGDHMREIFKDQNYSKAGRVRNIQRAMDIILYEHYIEEPVFCSLVTPYNFQRIWLQQQGEQVLFIYLTYNIADNRGKELFHINDFDARSGLQNLL